MGEGMGVRFLPSPTSFYSAVTTYKLRNQSHQRVQFEVYTQLATKQARSPSSGTWSPLDISSACVGHNDGQHCVFTNPGIHPKKVQLRVLMTAVVSQTPIVLVQ